MAGMLRQNSSLTVLDLRRTWLGAKGGAAIASTIGSNDSLIVLDISVCNVTASDLRTIVRKLNKNKAAREERLVVWREEQKINRQNAVKQKKLDIEQKRQEEENVWITEQRSKRETIRKAEAEIEAAQDAAEEAARVARIAKALEDARIAKEEGPKKKKKGKKKKKK